MPTGPRSDTPPAPAERSGTATGPLPLERGAVVTLPDSGGRRFRYAGRNDDGTLRFEPVAWTDAVASVSVGRARFLADVERGSARVAPSLSGGRRMVAELAALVARIRTALTPPEKGDVPHWLTR